MGSLRGPHTSTVIFSKPANPRGKVMSVFDFKFEKLLGQQVIRVLYFINFVLLTSTAILCLFINFSEEFEYEYRGSGWKALGLLTVVIAYLLLLIFSRFAYESIMIRFQMAEDIRAIRKKLVDDSQV
jgi:hypothetical protein